MFVCPECGGPQPVDGHCPADRTQLAPIGEDVLLGTTIGAYRVARLLGIGGMGRVYKGVHPTIGSRVAIKVLSRECTDRRDLVERFFSEAKAVNLIRHESIVNVLDLAMLPDGRPYIIMEYLDGAPLAAIVDHSVTHHRPMPLGGLARLAVEVLDALGAAHQKGIVHRDLKPDNIFITPSGRPKVLDFGIAKLSDLGASATRTGSLLGTPHYMAPEQAAGKPVDHRADIYAIGVILFECATGAKPFQADSLFELLRKHVEASPPSPRALRPDLSPGFEGLILTALAKSPDERFSSAHAMSMALQHATAELPADQWTPILGSGEHRAQPSGGWQPTPPATWARNPRSHARPSAQPPNQQQSPPIGHHSTVSASSGQVARQAPTRSSRKGLWIGLAAVALVGAGIAAIVAGTQPTRPAVVAADPPAPPVTPARKPTPPTDPEDLDVPDLAAVEDSLKQLPADAQKRIAEARKQLADARKLMPKPGAPTRAPTRAPTPDPVVVAEAPDPSAPVAAVTAPKAWLVTHALRAPPGWNPQRVDVDGFVRWAIAEAKKAVPDARLERISVDGVMPDGRANLVVSSGSIELRFVSPSRMKGDPSVPVGVAQKLECEFRIEGEPKSIQMRKITMCDRQTQVVDAPKCTAKRVWALAIAKGAPTGNVVASLSYYGSSTGGRVRWYLDIGSGHDKVFGHAFEDDDC
ncbi:MAG: protein kinase [Kofleriaceae bacterium]